MLYLYSLLGSIYAMTWYDIAQCGSGRCVGRCLCVASVSLYFVSRTTLKMCILVAMLSMLLTAWTYVIYKYILV